MKTMSLVCFLLLSIICDTLSAFVSKPSIQRKSIFERCTFQWRVSAPLTTYTVYNLTTGTPLPLSASANHFYRANERGGTVTLNIWDIREWDVGNYSLTVTTNSSTETDSSALLFLYENSYRSYIRQTSGPTQVTIGQAVELTCSVPSTSLPAAYRPKMHYTWYISSPDVSSYEHVELKSIGSGPAISQSGEVFNGYSIKDNGRTLVIDSVQAHDRNEPMCAGHEEGSPYPKATEMNFRMDIPLPPYTIERDPPNGKFLVSVGSRVQLKIYISETPTLTKITNWTFVDTAGRTRNLPPTATPKSTHLSGLQWYIIDFAFELTSSEFYGNYSITFVNSIGSLTETYRVMPPGPPDAPSNFRVRFASHAEISLEWVTTLDKDYKQAIFLQVNTLGNKSAVATWDMTVDEDPRKASLRQHRTVSENIHPETDYEARIWSTNIHGSSEVVKLTVRTLKRINLFVSSKTISLKGSRAIVNYTTSGGKISSLIVSCCVERTGNCSSYEFDLLSTKTQVILKNLPVANEYVFDFTASITVPYNHSFFAAMVKGVRVSRREIEMHSNTQSVRSTATKRTVMLRTSTDKSIKTNIRNTSMEKSTSTKMPSTVPAASTRTQRRSTSTDIASTGMPSTRSSRPTNTSRPKTSRISTKFSAFVSKPSIQRKKIGERCTFQWRLTESPTAYAIHSLTTGKRLPLNRNANHFYRADERGGVVTLNIWNIQKWDAGNYSLSVTMKSNEKNLTVTDSSALLFFYDQVSTTDVAQTSGPIPVTLGQTVEVTCTVPSRSLPAVYRPKMHYSWYISSLDVQLKSISSGPAISQTGDVLNGYSIKNDGRTLVIESVQDHDGSGIHCTGQEEGSPYSPQGSFNMNILLPPYTLDRDPPSGRLIATIGSSVRIKFYLKEYPTLTTITNWTFVDTSGRTRNLPPTANPKSEHFDPVHMYIISLEFELTSREFYGNYSITFVNNIGSLTETFRVMPPAPPDPPSNFRMRSASHAEISLEWIVILDKNYKEAVFLEVNALGNEWPIAQWDATFREDPIKPNLRHHQIVHVSDNIQPETDYEVRIWSANLHGPSEVLKLSVRTLKQMKLFVSPNTISLKGSRAIINYTTSGGKISSLNVTCCVERTGKCLSYEFDQLKTNGQVILNNLPVENEYVFDFTARAAVPYNHSYFAAMVKGVRVSRRARGKLNRRR